mgnify:CR=1 FL=1
MCIRDRNRIEKVLVIDQSGALGGLVTMKDIEKSAEYPDATKDESGSLMVGAALGTGPNTLKRAKALSEAGVDVFVIDSAHAHSKNVIETVKMIKKEFSIDFLYTSNSSKYLDLLITIEPIA